MSTLSSRHPNASRIEELYASIRGHEAETAALCYSEDAHFEDIAFRLEGRGSIRQMWQMICSRDVQVGFDSIAADDRQGIRALGSILHLQRHGAPRRQQHRLGVHLPRWPDSDPPRPVQRLDLGAPGVSLPYQSSRWPGRPTSAMESRPKVSGVYGTSRGMMLACRPLGASDASERSMKGT